jgi:hypothetical protein
MTTSKFAAQSVFDGFTSNNRENFYPIEFIDRKKATLGFSAYLQSSQIVREVSNETILLVGSQVRF